MMGIEDDRFPIVVIGGGLAGLSAARHLAERGLPVLVLEADSQWAGGRLAGGEMDSISHVGQIWEFRSQHGIHALWGAYVNMRALLARFVPLQLRPSTGEEWINRWGNRVRAVEAGSAVRNSWLPAPLHYLNLLFRPRFWRSISIFDFLSLPGFIISLMWATGLDPIREQKRLEGLMLEDFFIGWTRNLRTTFIGLAHSLLAAPSSQISLTGLVAALRFYTILRRDGWRMDYLPSNPHDCLLLPLIEGIRAAEGDVYFGWRVQSLAQVGDGWEIIAEDIKAGMTRRISAAQVILAVQSKAAAKILQNSPDTAQIAQNLRFPPTLRNATIRLWYDRAPREGAAAGMFTGDFMVDNFFWLHRMQDEFISWHEQTGGAAIEVHLYADDSILDKPNELLIIEATKEVQAAFPELRGHFIQAVLRRNSATQPRFEVPCEADTLGVITPWMNLFACGDWIAYPTPALWMERSTITSIAAANQVLARHKLEPFPILEPPQAEFLARALGALVWLGRRTVGRLILSSARAIKRARLSDN